MRIELLTDAPNVVDDAVVGKVGELGYPEVYLKTETAVNYYDKLSWERVEQVVSDDSIESWIFKKSASKTLQR